MKRACTVSFLRELRKYIASPTVRALHVPIQVDSIFPANVRHYEIGPAANRATHLRTRVDSQDLPSFQPTAAFQTQAT